MEAGSVPGGAKHSDWIVLRTNPTRSLAAEVMVKGNRAALVRARQPVKAIWSGEKAAPWQK